MWSFVTVGKCRIWATRPNVMEEDSVGLGACGVLVN